MDLEKSLLSKLTNNDELKVCWDFGLRESVFEDPLNRSVFQFVLDYWLENTMLLPPTVEIVLHEFPGFYFVDSQESTRWLIEKLKSRLLTNMAQDMMRNAASIAGEDPVKAIRNLMNESWEASEMTSPRNTRVDLSKTIEQRRARYIQKIESETRLGVPIGLHEVDEHTGGIQPGELAVVSALPKVGKSFTLINAAVEQRKAGLTPVVFTLEQSIPEFEDRMDAFITGIGYGKITEGRIPIDDLKKMKQRQEEFAELGPLYIERPDRGERTVQHLIVRARQLGADSVIIDQLSFMESRRDHEMTRSKYSEMIFDLKEEISRETAGAIPCLLAVQLNRKAASNGGRGQLDNIAESSDIERTVDIAFGLHRTPELRNNKSMILDIMGSRRSDIKSWLLAWHLGDRTEISVREEYED